MKFFMHFAFVALLGASFEVRADQEWPKTVYATSGPYSYLITIRQFHECVACNDNAQARTDYDACLGGLSPQKKEIMRRCCESTYDKKFCEEAASGKTNYATICKYPRKGFAVDRCFEKKTNKDEADIKLFMECKKQIRLEHCTTKSGDLPEKPFEM